MNHSGLVRLIRWAVSVLMLCSLFFVPLSTQGASLAYSAIPPYDDVLQRSFDFRFRQECTSEGQLCNPPWNVTLRTPRHITINYIVPDNHCSSIRLHVLV